jgi:hypothetical protein
LITVRRHGKGVLPFFVSQTRRTNDILDLNLGKDLDGMGDNGHYMDLIYFGSRSDMFKKNLFFKFGSAGYHHTYSHSKKTEGSDESSSIYSVNDNTFIYYDIDKNILKCIFLSDNKFRRIYLTGKTLNVFGIKTAFFVFDINYKLLSKMPE